VWKAREVRAIRASLTRRGRAAGRVVVLVTACVAAASCASAHAKGAVQVPIGPAAKVVSSIAIRRPVVFVTIDDGFIRDPRVITFVEQSHWPISVFLIGKEARADPSYFRRLQAAGATINDHTDTHPHLVKLSYDAQRQQICKPVRDYPALLGARPVLFRAPWGQVDQATLVAARSCGFTTIMHWSAEVFQGHFVTLHGGPPRPGDIILMHFEKYTYSDLVRLQRTLAAAHLSVGRLEDYMKFASTVPMPDVARWSGNLAA
jgi:peptidoglycan/xylan/chitin deacetylase (PgdA/CDA1 family)